MSVSCDLRLDNSEGIYRPGEMITGHISVAFQERVLMRALALKVSGYATTSWVKPSKKKQKKNKKNKQVVYSQHESYLSTTNYFIGSEDATPRTVEPGPCHHSFSISLPAQCPTNFESTVGQIRYELEVFLECPGEKLSLYKRHFHVKRSLDLHSVIGLDQSYNLETIERKTFLQFWRRPLQMQLSLSKLGYVPGENMTVQVKVLNYDLVNLTDIVYKFNLVASYTGMHKKKASSTIERRNLTTITHNLFGQGGTVVNAVQTITVPADIPSTLYLYDCRCIQISYELEVQLVSSKKGRTLGAVIPITIGTVSLSVNGSQPNGFKGNGTVLSAARSMGDLSATPSAPPETPEVEGITTFTVNAMVNNTSFREADFMPSSNLNENRKHSKSMDQVNFKPKYLYYNLNNPTVEEERSGECVMPSLRNMQYPQNDIDAIHIDQDYKGVQ